MSPPHVIYPPHHTTMSKIFPDALADLDEEVTRYRWDPVYTMVHVGVNATFRPTGGELLFRVMPPVANLKRRIMGKEYKDVITLAELTSILTNENPGLKGVQMYRPMFETDGTLSIVKLVKNIRLFGVTSINQCRDWHKDFMATVQPALIYGACHVDKTDYRKQDTLRLPASLCEVVQGRSNDTRHFVFFTFVKDGGRDWKPRFIITPFHDYVNEEMMEIETVSLVYRVGIVDFVNAGPDHTSVHMYKAPEEMKEEPKWYVEGFVFNPHGGWTLRRAPSGQTTLSDLEMWEVLEYDSSKPATMRLFVKQWRAEHPKDGGPPSRKRHHDSNRGGPNGKGPRFIGGGTLWRAGQQRPLRTAPDLSDIPRFTPLASTRSFTDNPGTSRLLTFTLNRFGAARRLTRHFERQFSAKLKTAGDHFMRRLDTHIIYRVGRHRWHKTIGRLAPGESVTVDATTVFYILAMAFLGRLRITSHTDAHAAREAETQMSMDRLFVHARLDKIACLVNYFQRCMSGTAQLHGRSVTYVHSTANSHVDTPRALAAPLVILEGGPGIEDVHGGVFADFANKKFGGGVFGTGAVQEEILTIIHPETLLGRALFDTMTDTSSVAVTGALRFSNYTGYGSGPTPFTFGGPRPLPPPGVDRSGRALTEIVAMDATKFKNNVTQQYTEHSIYREYAKAAVAFAPLAGSDPAVPVVSGRWGSGDFRGDPILKILIQIAAASRVERPLILVKVGENEATVVKSIVAAAIPLDITPDNLMRLIEKTVRGITYTQDQRANSANTGIAILAALQQQSAQASRSSSKSSAHSSHTSESYPMPEYGDSTGDSVDTDTVAEADVATAPPPQKKRNKKTAPVQAEPT